MIKNKRLVNNCEPPIENLTVLGQFLTSVFHIFGFTLDLKCKIVALTIYLFLLFHNRKNNTAVDGGVQELQ